MFKQTAKTVQFLSYDVASFDGVLSNVQIYIENFRNRVTINHRLIDWMMNKQSFWNHNEKGSRKNTPVTEPFNSPQEAGIFFLLDNFAPKVKHVHMFSSIKSAEKFLAVFS